MGKKYLDTKKHSIESSILSVWQEASLKQEKLDAVNKNAVKKKFDDRKDKDIDNDGDVDSSDKYLHKRRKAVSKAMKDEGNAFGKALRDAKEKGEKTFVVAGKTYDVKEEDDIDEKLTPAQRRMKDKYQAARGGRELGGAPGRELASNPGASKPGDRAKTMNRIMQRGYKKKKARGRSGAAGTRERGRLGVTDAGVRIRDQFIPAGSGKNESYEMGTDEYRKHTQEITPGQEIQDYGRFKVQSMKEALAKVWGLDESESSVKKEKKDLTKELKGGKTLTGKESDTVDVEPKLEKKK